MKTYDLNLKSIFRAEQVQTKPHYDLVSYHNELKYTSSLLKVHAARVARWITGTDDGSTFNSEFKELMAEIVERGDVPKPRREAVKRFYAKTMAKLDDPKDRMILCQCIATMDDGEELNLGDMYIDDFNAALIECKEAKGDE